MVDMNMFAAGYGGNQGQQTPTNPMQGTAAPQKAVNMPGAIGDIVAAMKGGYDKGVANRNASMPGPTLAGAGAPTVGMSDATGLHSPDFPLASPMPPGAGGLPGPVATMPPTTAPPMPGGGNPIPFTEGTPGLPGIGKYVGPPGNGLGIMDLMKTSGMPTGGLMDIFGGNPSQDPTMAALLNGPGPAGGWGMFG